MTVKIDNVRIVLVETSHPGNIGATARAMKNMTFSDLALVSPKNYPEIKGQGKAYARASGATDVLYAATIYNSLAESIADCDLVIGASARLRAVTWPELNPREMAEKIFSVESVSNDNTQKKSAGEVPVFKKAAIVFGREDAGLDNDEMDLCQFLVHIPANADYTSLNIAAAVQVLCYEVYMTALLNQGTIAKAENDHPMATSQEIEYFYQHLEDTLVQINFLNPSNPMQLMRRLRKLFNRSGLDKIEVNILRGILTAVSRSLTKSD